MKTKRRKKYIALEKKMVEFGDTHQILANYLKVAERTLWARRYGEYDWTVQEIVMLQKRYYFSDEELLSFIFDEEMLSEITA